MLEYQGFCVVSGSLQTGNMTTGFCFTVNFYVKKVRVKSFSCVLLFATPWTVAYQVPLSVGFSRQKYWSRLPFPSPGDPPNPGIELGSLALQADALWSEPPGKSLIKKVCNTVLICTGFRNPLNLIHSFSDFLHHL